jgi:hypothetical protein
MVGAVSELVDVRADAVAPGECICLGGVAILITAVEHGDGNVDLHTCYGPALRYRRDDTVPVVIAAEETDVA